ncbi:hypothetical protein QQX98_004575 [Neonectria punicea]|uniref:Uncharacterized protein n=1 Tax=Neonectria punicea TaxID=979145 RepID=A0ABR1H8U9_9HYPO
MPRHCGEFASWLQVIYTDDDDKPNDTINEINGQSSDINKGQGGSYVWLRLHRADKPSMMANNFWGAGGDYRYVQWSNDRNADRLITDVALWRSDDSQGGPPNGWDGKTQDINSGRGGDYLYLVWRTNAYSGPRSP